MGLNGGNEFESIRGQKKKCYKITVIGGKECIKSNMIGDKESNKKNQSDWCQDSSTKSFRAPW